MKFYCISQPRNFHLEVELPISLALVLGGTDQNSFGCFESLNSLLRFRQDVKQSSIRFSVGHHPLARTRHKVADTALKGLPAVTRAAN